MSIPSFAVIIPTRDRPEQLARCLASLADLDYPRDCYEVIIVDDGGSADAECVVRRFEATMRVRFIRAGARGPAAARNTAMRSATGEFLAFTDDDCTVDRRWLRAFAARLDARPDAMIGGKVLNGLEGNRYSRASQGLQDFLYAWYHNGSNRSLRFFTTNNIAMRRSDFENLGGFDESFRFASEDRDLSDRALAAGLDLIYAPEAVVRHAHYLRLPDFLRQHFRYGKGAAHFHRTRRKRRRERVRLEPPAFYLGILTSPYRLGSPEPFIASMLLVASQSALLAGAIWGVASRVGGGNSA